MGHELVRAVGTGLPVTSDALRPPLAVHRGEVVTVLARAGGIRIRTNARAREEGSVGELVAVESLSNRSTYYARVTGSREVEVYARPPQVENEPLTHHCPEGKLTMPNRITSILILAVIGACRPCGRRAEQQPVLRRAAARARSTTASARAPAKQVRQQQNAGLTLADTSWTFQSPADRKTYEVNDIVKVTVSVKSQMTSSGQIDRKKTGYSDWKLTDWIKIYPNWNLGENGGATGQPPYGTPEVRGDLDSKLQAQGNLQTKDMYELRHQLPHCRQAAQRQPGAGRHLERQRQRREVGVLALRRMSDRKTSARAIRSSATRSPTCGSSARRQATSATATAAAGCCNGSTSGSRFEETEYGTANQLYQ